MKLYFCLFLLILILPGCKKEQTVYQSNIKGTWQVYKYVLYNIQETGVFQDNYTDYTIKFDGAGNYSEFYHNSVDTFTPHGTYYFTSYYNTLVLTQSQPDSLVRTYSVFDLTGSAVQLRTDTSQLYMSKDSTI
jgi:hypothetical protein